MRLGLGIRKALLTTTAVAAFAACGDTSVMAGDTEALLSLLASKGVISSSEARAVTSAPPAEQGDRLVAILRKKGVLADGDMQALKSKSRPASVATTDARPAPASVVVPPATAPVGPAPMPRKAASIEVGGFEIAPVGYLALTGVSRNTNAGTATTTNFGAIPFNNTIQGNNTETRLSAQNSVLGLRAHGNIRGVDLTGYFEGDFNGNDPANVYVNSNSHTFRMRLAYADVKAGQFETTFGQTYSWLTPNRYGMGPDPSDIFLTNNIDQNYQVGLPWARQAAAHFAWHATPNFTIGAGVENPQQFTNNEVVFPTAFNAQLQNQFDNGANPGTPNRIPDVVAKAAYDSDVWSGTRLHLEAAGMWRHFRVNNLVQGAPDFGWHDANGWATTVAGNLEFFNTFTLVGNAFWSAGGGRYLGALGPDVVALPTGPAGMHDIALSTVRSHGFLGGFEWRVLNPTVLSAYYGQAYFDRNYAVDTTSMAPVQPYIGFGFPGSLTIPGSANSNNKQIEQWTLDLKHTFWADPQYGAITGLAQYSYLRREAWFVANGAPPEAHTHLFFTELRYQLPGN
ncbi:hypothetical protein [Bradyrhizobium neotropicale]|uniref:Porin n=1 Tax=Bradyrhizobium neotropicale TaxID=1497615 RepID=A0A176ZC85_9BRAD|nr:hypothetical protein [Bradyrhizobium neotropicale]OAF18240.1 hypothetical protein AXW67_05000 [Bradyrhizobium neotropicale]